MRIRFDRGPEQETGGAAARFDAPERLIEAQTPEGVPMALAALDAALAEGLWIAGYASYELGYALEPRLLPLIPEDRRVPLLRFGAYRGPEEAPALHRGPASLTAPRPQWDSDRYAYAFRRLHDWIGAGDIYQANLTFPLGADVTGTTEAIYAALTERQAVGHGVLIEQDSGPALLSRSPELFFRIHAGGKLETLPMKGTMPRGETDVDDAANRAFLWSDTKNRAENLMIVDLLRNDLSRIAEVGSVKVPELFKVETYATVHQMVSRVTGQLQPGTGLGDVFRALYPCGSITGAPKLRSMEIIRALEGTARDIYCGSIGWAAPDGRAEFNVAIRTMMVEDGKARLNVGGGVVWDSTAPSEYEEALWKARYAAAFQTEHG
ncbi:aminodeoxychorismate synthase component I [Marivivens marinus]|uniref:aminodeoxychorismate synthase component I n=1 Tax=Marivivens marinus TaxID=3110173 RepID=UPI003B845F61